MTGAVLRGRLSNSLRGLRVTLVMLALLWVGLTCGKNSDGELLRQYAKCMADSNTVLHRQTFSNATGAIPLSAEATEHWLQNRLETGEITMAEIRASYARHCW